jgi:hypothetical protein
MLNIIYELEAKTAGPIPIKSGVPVGDIVISEFNSWDGRAETDPGVLPILTKYWEPIDIEWTPSGTPWSAAYISWVAKQVDSGFPATAAHWQYADAVIRGDVPGWTGHSILQNQARVPLAVGDILVRPRGSGDRSTASFWYTHGDIVGKIADGKAYLYGGNLSDTNKIAAVIPVDSQGYATAKIRDYVVILKGEKKSRAALLTGLALIAITGGILWMTKKKK